MQPIHELLNQIKWDPNFSASEFEIGYYDRVQAKIIRVPFSAMLMTKTDHFDFEIYDDEGQLHTIPLHRIKQVFRDGELIWHREH